MHLFVVNILSITAKKNIVSHLKRRKERKGGKEEAE
jgi:hypothetical protein